MRPARRVDLGLPTRPVKHSMPGQIVQIMRRLRQFVLVERHQILRQLLQMILRYRQVFQVMQPVDPCWKDVEEVVIQPQLPQTLLIADLIRQRCQPVVPQIDL